MEYWECELKNFEVMWEVVKGNMEDAMRERRKKWD